MTLPEISIKRPVFAWMIFWGIILFGILSFKRLGISQMPDVDFPVINISLSMNGASPEVMETNIVDILEDSLLSVEGITRITSTSNYGQANITVELELSRNVDAALQEVQARIAQAQRLLPASLDPPIISKSNPEDTPIIWVSITSEGDKRELMLYVRDRLKNQFSVIPGVGQIQLGGFADRNLRIWIDGKKLRELELTVNDIETTIKKEHSEQPAGQIESSKITRNVRSMGEADSFSIFSNFRIPFRGSIPILERQILLKDVARIEDGLEDIKRSSRFNGKLAVGLGVIKQRGTNAVEVAKLVKNKVKELKSELPTGMDLNISFDSSVYIEESIHELEFTLILSILLTSIVCYLFLGSWSSTWNILLSIPTSIIGSLIIMDFFGFTLNTFTLLALSLAIGIVVDDAIMILENIVRHREMGKSLIQAAKDGSNEISFAAFATTLSITAIFLPVVFMPGVIGRYFFQFGIIISTSVLLSLLEALTLTPMRASKYLQIGNSNLVGNFIENFLKKIETYYAKILKFVLDNSIKILFIALAIFIFSFLFFIPLKKEFVPSQDQSRFILRLQTPVGSSLAYTDEEAKKVEQYLLSQGEVLRVYSSIGGMGGGQMNQASFFVTLKSPKERPIRKNKKKVFSQSEFASYIRKDLQQISKDWKIAIQDLSSRGFAQGRGFPIEFTIQGKDWKILASASEKIKDEMKNSNLFTDVDSNFQISSSEVQVFPDRVKAAYYGVTIDSIGNAIGTLIGGNRIGQFTEGGHRYDIRVRLEAKERETKEQIRNIFIRNSRGELVELANLVKIDENPALQSITRVNRERAITIYANQTESIGQSKALEKALEIAKKNLPEGYSSLPTGSGQNLSASFQALYMALVLGIVVAYMILASQFNSYIDPIIVLLALPFSFSGAVAALWLFGYSLNIFSFIALLLLMGLVKKNSILLVEFANQLHEKGATIQEAITKACPIRLRPILMTSIATITAAIPPALSIGPGAESRIPMAIALIGGMLLSTFLTLFVVPSAYLLFKKK